jgi:dTDP-4-amino-4,6-dideoxygalactose transaminase
VNSCTAGLMLVLSQLDARGPVVMPSFTFAASAHAVHWAAGTPAWAEVRDADLTLDPDDARAEIAATGAVAMTATHIYGTPCQTEALAAVAADAGIPLVYDAAHALGSLRGGRPVGGFGTAEVFSMSPTKVTTAGEGGLVATSDEALAAAIRIGRDYGNPGDYDCRFVGLNARMSELHAAVGLASLEGLDERLAHRAALVEAFRAVTDGLPGLRYPALDDGDTSTYKDLTLVLEDGFGLHPSELGAVLRADGIDSRRYYYPPIHRQQAYADLPGRRDLPVTDRLAEQVITPPLYSHMTVEQAQRVAAVVVAAQANSAEVRRALQGHVNG